jgi:proliferating cell nuclear antigen
MIKFKTVQSTAFKTAFEVLKDILNDVNIVFTRNSIRITTLDTARSALVDVTLESENFEEYEYTSDKSQIVVGINVTNMFKLLKTITNNDTLSITITDSEFLHILISNSGKKCSTSFKLKLLDISEDIIELPDVDMSVITTIQSLDFQRLCRDMSNVGTDIEIKRYKNTLKVICNGDFASQETEIEVAQEVDKVYEGLYSLKYLNLFTKATNMCSFLQLLQEEENKFLLLKYNVASLGSMSFYLASKTEE